MIKNDQRKKNRITENGVRPFQSRRFASFDTECCRRELQQIDLYLNMKLLTFKWICFKKLYFTFISTTGRKTDVNYLYLNITKFLLKWICFKQVIFHIYFHHGPRNRRKLFIFYRKLQTVRLYKISHVCHWYHRIMLVSAQSLYLVLE